MNAFFDKLARFLALLGGAVLSLLVIMTCISILGRSVNSMLHSDLMQGLAPGLAEALIGIGIGPINGDFELVEAGMAFVIFAFLPLCQMHGAHASVDIFTQALPPRVNRALRTVIEIVFAIVLVVIAVQLYSGMLSKQSSGQTTFLLEFPVWWSYAVSLVGAFAAALVSVYVAVMRLVETTTGRRMLPPEMGADH